MGSAVCRPVPTVSTRYPEEPVACKESVRRNLGDMSIKDALADANTVLGVSYDFTKKIISFLRYQDPLSDVEKPCVTDMQTQVYDICDMSNKIHENLQIIATMLGAF